MQAGQPSRTAQGAAMHRAFHQMHDAPPILDDPWAVRIIGADAAEALRTGEDWHAQPSAAALRALIVTRSRLAEDCLAEGYASGIRQYVLLGAGLDTFAYRNGFAGLRVIEIDFPATQVWKRERIAAIGADGIKAAYAPVDFEHETIVDGLQRAAFDFAAPAVFAWLGVTMYLAPETIFATLGLIAERMAAGSEIVFDFSVTPEDDAGRGRRAAFAERAALLGEPIKSDFVPDEMAAMVRGLGFLQVDLWGPRELNARYFAGRADAFALRRGHILRARV